MPTGKKEFLQASDKYQITSDRQEGTSNQTIDRFIQTACYT
jgi:hypothetical protein